MTVGAGHAREQLIAFFGDLLVPEPTAKVVYKFKSGAKNS